MVRQELDADSMRIGISFYGKKILSEKSPIFGRRDSQIRLKALNTTSRRGVEVRHSPPSTPLVSFFHAGLYQSFFSQKAQAYLRRVV